MAGRNAGGDDSNRLRATLRRFSNTEDIAQAYLRAMPEFPGKQAPNSSMAAVSRAKMAEKPRWHLSFIVGYYSAAANAGALLLSSSAPPQLDPWPAVQP